MTHRHASGTVLWPREAEVKRRVYALLRRLGCHIADLSQGRRSHVAPGLPDAYVWPPAGKPPFWYEAKSPDGKQRSEQRVFQQRCELAGVGYVLGGYTDIEAHLRTIGVL